ncbi:MAG: serA [Peptococcaceae bacterium]|jgi:D-3-phosphoglycerate dehydrogenase|nr:serA [Peptococcaceae bacterium]
MKDLIFIAEKINPPLLKKLEETKLCEMFIDETLWQRQEELIGKVKDATIIVAKTLTLITKDVIEAAPGLKLIARDGIGLENVDVDTATAKGIPITMPMGANAVTVAEFAVGLTLSLLRQIVFSHVPLKTTGEWQRFRFFGKTTELYGKTVGIVGLGAIGYQTARRLQGFGVKILGYDPYVGKNRALEVGCEMTNLQELLAQSDVVILHAPQTAETTGMIGEAELKLMKNTAYIVNVARAPLIQHDALYKALSEKWIAGAALDVFHKEPINPDDPLLQLDNVIVTPHHAGGSIESTQRMAEYTFEDIVRALKGEPVLHYVNIPMLRK